MGNQIWIRKRGEVEPGREREDGSVRGWKVTIRNKRLQIIHLLRNVVSGAIYGRDDEQMEPGEVGDS